MPSIGSITKTIRINAENTALVEELVDEGMSFSGAVNKLIRGTPQNENKGTPQTMYEEELTRMANELGVDEFTLLEIIDYLISEKKLYRDEKGKLKLKGIKVDPEYVSVDDKIDSMKLSEKEKNRLKSEILSTLESQKDLTGNGGGL